MGKNYALDRRSRRTEEAILRVLFEEEDLSLGEMAKRIGVARSTIYRHYKNVREIVLYYQEDVLEKCECLVRRVERKEISPKVVFERILVLIVQNKLIFEVLLKNKGTSVLKEMILMLKPMVVEYLKLPSRFDRAFLIYVDEVAGEIGRWIVEGCEESKTQVLMANLMYLTDTMRPRLGAIVDS